MKLIRAFLSRTPALALLALLMSALTLSVVYAGGYAAFGGSTAALRGQIAQAFAAGDLPRQTTDTPDRRNGSLTYNDCLILTMAANDSQPRLLKTITPAPVEAIDDRALDSNTCEMLYRYVVEGRVSEFRSWPYHRYVSAFVAPVAALAPVLGVAGLRRALELLNYAAVALIGLAAALSLSRLPPSEEAARLRMAAGCILSLVLLGFFGMEFYSMNLSIGLAEPVVFALLAMLLFGRVLDWSTVRFGAWVSLAFALITSLEFWTGQIPFAAAAGVGLIGLHVATPDDAPRAARRALEFLFVAGATIALTFALKIAVASAVFGENVLANFMHQLEVRVGDREYGLVNLVLHMAGRADHIGQGSLTLGLLSGLAAALAFAWGLWRVASAPPSEETAVARLRIGFLLASVAVVLGWHLLFRNHSTIHSEFMVRTFAWVWAAGWIGLAVGLRLPAARRTWQAVPAK
ncbi:hypothetical protein NK718_14620 [Alsobacter sp. SYSU M60028]|uniref:DUF2142 domain-containing protein n=1 Tax=Alsobacter ponti TaxID=2962936 RepID=A0ABT1LEA2_9HYPH|nr:hypothetical protein [Alsobacter ponti]MCP8939759.1 hypothetical protein [Alsobacter ponti]